MLVCWLRVKHIGYSNAFEACFAMKKAQTKLLLMSDEYIKIFVE